GLLDQLLGAVSSLTLMCYIMFTMWPETIARHGTTDLVFTVPVVMYGLFRYDFLVHREAGGGNPSGTLLTDRHLLGTVLLFAVAAGAILGTQHTGGGLDAPRPEPHGGNPRPGRTGSTVAGGGGPPVRRAGRARERRRPGRRPVRWRSLRPPSPASPSTRTLRTPPSWTLTEPCSGAFERLDGEAAPPPRRRCDSSRCTTDPGPQGTRHAWWSPRPCDARRSGRRANRSRVWRS